jgi:hypothetical protein
MRSIVFERALHGILCNLTMIWVKLNKILESELE